MWIVKYLVLNFRNRLVQLLLSVLTLLSIFVYHHATSHGILRFPFSTAGQSSSSHVGRLILNTSDKVQDPSAGMNSILEPGRNNQLISNISASQPLDAVEKMDGENSVNAIYRRGHFVKITEKCPGFGEGMKLLILIMSAPQNELARKGIRLTWGHFDQRMDISIAFVLGNTTDSKIEKNLQIEQNTFRDIIRGDFIDSYSNLVLKTISAFEWVCQHCFKAKFVLKVDDDMFINVPQLTKFVEQRSREKNVIFGRLARGWKPRRDIESKYYVSEDDYEPKIFPSFTTGPAYLLTNDVVPKIFQRALEHKFFKLEDVFVTGIVAEELGVRRLQGKGFLNQKKPLTACNLQRTISIHMVKYSDQFDLWKKLLDGQAKCK